MVPGGGRVAPGAERKKAMYSKRFFLATIIGPALLAAALPLMMSSTRAGTLASPSGEVVLTIDGTIGNGNADGRMDFDMAMIKAMPATRFRTNTPWTSGPVEFEGVLLKDLFGMAAVTGTKIRATALNDYIVDLDYQTLLSAGAIVAYRVDGAEISVREKGPLWIMFPFDEKPELKAETIYSQSVWQLRKLTFQN